MSYSDQSDDDQEPTYEIIFEDDVNNSEDIKQSGRKGDRYLRRDGRATAKFANDDIYVGEYRDGKRNGQGIYTFANRAVYSGTYVDNRKHGFGTFTAPDGGIYEGDWVEDKREGHGTYKYPNGDVYKGGWKAGAKHGTGTYTYAAQGCSVTGDWSNGQLMHGTWSMHDGSKYVGEFSGNQPQGAGLYVFASGHTESGRYLDGKWVQDEFVQPPPNAVPPKPVPIDPFRESCRAMDKAVLKVDHFEAIYRLKKEIEGVPNYRKIADYHVYGCGQPTLDGFRLMLEAIAENGCDKVVWINMRNEPVIYVNTWSYAPRSQHDLNENMELLGLTVQQLGELETRIMQKTKKDCQSRGGLHHYYKDTFAENPADRKNLQLIDNVSDLEHIRTVQQIYDVLSEDDYDVTYHRLPIVDERSPSHADFDNLVEIIKNADPAAAIVFNCQMGKGRTTTGTVIACLIRRVLDEEGKGDEAEPQEFEEPDPSQQKSHGQYTIIMNLVKALPRGEVIKQEVDDVIDRCRAMQNLRDCIHYTKEMYMSESESRRGFWKRMSYNFVERYFMLILFHAYLKQAVEDDFATSFSKWVAAHPQYMELLGNRVEGPLSTFEWN